MQTANKALRERFAAAAAARRLAVASALRSAGAEHLRLRTDRDWVIDFARHLASRKRGRPLVKGVA